ncbi:MAG: hypothetical protein AAFP03_05970 [Cyanobacteria bacterium J06598_3]
MFLPIKVKASLAIAALSLLITSAPAAATTFTFETNRTGGSSLAGTQKAFSTRFNDETNVLEWSSTYSRNTTNNNLTNGGWLVLTNGPQPADLETAIFYLDGINNKVSAYDYDPIDRKHSWRNSEFLGETALNVTNTGDERTFDFLFDMTDINAKNLGPNWKGGSFDSEIGIWFHAVADLDIAYENGEISKFKHGDQSRYDTKALKTTVLDTVVLGDEQNNAEAVPEPATAAAVGLFAAAATFTKRRHHAA